MVRKQAGVLLKHKWKGYINILQWGYNKPRRLIKRIVKPIYPKIKVPELNKLFLRKDYPELDSIRWKLAFWCISDFEDIGKGISDEFIIPYLCVWYLIEVRN